MSQAPDAFTPFDLIMQQTDPGDPERQTLISTIHAIEQGGRKISALLQRGPLLGITGSAHAQNVQGEEVQAMDQIGQETFLTLFRQSGSVLGVLSEEAEHPDLLPVTHSAPCLVAMDPLDGSSNLSVNAPVGSIFALFRPSGQDGSPSGETLFINSSSNLIAAAYLLYSVSTTLVLAIGREAHTFTMEPATGEYLGSGVALKFPEGGKIYSTNEGYLPSWEKPLQQYMGWIKTERNPTMILRYIGALVGDFHRNLLKGGIYLYPADIKNGKKSSGKLRLLYEAYPMAFIARNAGGIATDGTTPILSIVPNNVHQRVPLIVGSLDLVREFQDHTGSPLN
ncbi:MAG: class 1 fructose-bisphosphatase [Leptospirales bacterium]